MKPQRLFAAIFAVFAAAPLAAITAEEIMRRNKALPKPLSSKGTVKLVVKHQAREESQSFQVFTQTQGGITYSRINFLGASRMQFLVHSKPGTASSQWIKLSDGRIRQVASADRGGSWAGSHFYYEDLQTYDIQKYALRLLPEGTVKGYKKETIPCYRIEATPRHSGDLYSKRIVYVDKATFRIIRVVFYERGRHTKTLTNYLFMNIAGVNTPKLVYMEPAAGGGSHSYLLLQDMQYNIPLSMNLFRRSSF